jgi:sugar/nucleoside kinase (ribokinase family)
MISFGSVFLELVFGHVPAPPEPGQEIFADEFAVSVGGAVTSATAAARSGASVGLCTVLGEDLGGRVVTGHCSREGIDLSPSARVPRRATGITMVLNYEGDRSFVTHQPPHPADEPPELARWTEVLRTYRPAWCYVHAGAGRTTFLRAARQQGTRILLDVSLNEIAQSSRAVLDCVPLADVFVPNQAELMALTAARSRRDAVSVAGGWDTSVVVKLGAAGAMLVGPDGVAEVTEGVTPVNVRDLTGAGDSFAGAVIGELLRGVPLARAVVAGNRAGAEAAARLGAVGPVEVAGFSARMPDLEHLV